MNTDIKPQRPAQGISVSSDWKDATSYHIECDCHSPDHAVNMWIEVDHDNETKDVDVTFYVETWTPFWEKTFSRIRCAWDVLVHGVHKQQHCLILNRQSALNLAKVLETKVEQLSNR